MSRSVRTAASGQTIKLEQTRAGTIHLSVDGKTLVVLCAADARFLAHDLFAEAAELAAATVAGGAR